MNTRKSRFGYLFTLGRVPINYKSKQQTCVAQSICEAGHYSTADATKEGLHLRQLLGEIFNAPIVTKTTTIWEYNQSAIAYSQNALVSEKTKHVGLKWHFLKDHVEQGTIKLRYLPTDHMVADMFTKPLP
jgi:KUP system potassium uptake protein